MAFKGRKEMLGAPPWYNTPIEKLDFEWSPEEKVLIDRYCDQIQKNIDEEGGMTPLERLNATLFGGDRDRMPTFVGTTSVYISHALDHSCDAVKPVDTNRYPKIWILAHLATHARFKIDYCNLHNINYGEDMWGGQSKMIDYGNPIILPPYPVKSIEDLEGMPIPDARKDGLYPGYLWANREYRRIIKEHNLPIPLWASICPGPDLLMMMGMVGWGEFAMYLRRDPEMIKKGMDIATQFLEGFGKAMIDECQPEAIWC